MPESELHPAVLEIIKDHKNLVGECSLTSKEIFDLLPPGERPADFRYIDAVIRKLKAKKQIETRSKFSTGHSGMKRIIKVL
ncbi:MAG: hypothetical protein AABY22_26285 [Nanoarchaeota archaeon]